LILSICGELILIEFVESEQQILKCYPQTGQLRAHLCKSDFLLQVTDKFLSDIVYSEEEKEIKAVAGFQNISSESIA